MSAQMLYDALIAAITDGSGKHEGNLTLDQWRLGFVIGQMIGLINPDLSSGDRALSCLELLSANVSDSIQQTKLSKKETRVMPELITTHGAETSDGLFQDVCLICDVAHVETLVTEFTRLYADTSDVQVYDWGCSTRFEHGYIVLECEESHLSRVLQQVQADPRIRGSLVYDLPDVLTTPGLFCVQKKGGAPHASK